MTRCVCNQNNIDICPSNPSDFQDILRLENEEFNPPYTPQMITQMLISSTVFKACCGEKTIGYIALDLIGEEAEVLKIVIQKEYRGLGAGKKLLGFALNKFKESGVKEVFLEVDESNKSAIAFYLRAGFGIIGKRLKYYGDKAAVLLRLSL